MGCRCAVRTRYDRQDRYRPTWRSTTVPEISLLIDGTQRSFPAATTGTDLFGEDRSVVAVRVDGQLAGLAAELPGGADGQTVHSDARRTGPVPRQPPARGPPRAAPRMSREPSLLLRRAAA